MCLICMAGRVEPRRAPPGGAGGGPGNRQAGKARQEKVTGPGGNFGQSLFVDVCGGKWTFKAGLYPGFCKILLTGNFCSTTIL